MKLKELGHEKSKSEIKRLMSDGAIEQETYLKLIYRFRIGKKIFFESDINELKKIIPEEELIKKAESI